MSEGRGGVWPVALIVLLAVGGLVLASLPGGEEGRARSSFSTERDGRMVAFLLLDDLGFPARAWREPPGALPRGQAVLWLPAAPPSPPDYLRELWAEADAEAEAGSATRAERRNVGRKRDPRHYRRFLEEGGTLVVGLDDERRAFLEQELGLEMIAELARAEEVTNATDPDGERVRRDGLVRVALAGGETLSVDAGVAPDGEGPWLTAERTAWRPILADPADPSRGLAWRVSVGRGELIAVADDDVFGNLAIRQADNGLLLVRLFEAAGGGDALLFDEYALSGELHTTAIELALGPGKLGFTLHVIAVLALLSWWAAWSAAFPRDPEQHGAASSVARARAHGATLARLGRHDVLADMLRRGVIARLAGGGQRAPLEVDDLAAARALLAPYRHVVREPAEVDRWARELLARDVTTAEELEDYAERLARLERLASRGTARHNPAPPRARS